MNIYEHMEMKNIESFMKESLEETVVDEVRVEDENLPFVIKELKKQLYYKRSPSVVDDMINVYNAAIRACCDRIEKEYTFLPSSAEYCRHLKEILTEKMIKM